jgi:hypothetical protein
MYIRLCKPCNKTLESGFLLHFGSVLPSAILNEIYYVYFFQPRLFSARLKREVLP